CSSSWWHISRIGARSAGGSGDSVHRPCLTVLGEDSAENHHRDSAIADRVGDDAGPGAPRSLTDERERERAGEHRGETEQRRVIEDVERGPERPIYGPRPASERDLLSRQDVAAPPELFAKDVEDEQHHD